MGLPTTKIESRAINVLEALADRHASIDYDFNKADKEMSWDGHIQLHEIGASEFSKKSFKFRAPVQIKGHSVDDDKLPSNDTKGFPVDLLDLKLYSTEKGVIYFHIFLGDDKSEIFYRSLYPSVIASFIDRAKEKGNEKSITIQFTRLDDDPEVLYEIVNQFCLEAYRQGSTGTPLVQDRIRISDFDKIDSVSMNIIGDLDDDKILKKMAAGDICMYGKTGDDKYSRPLEWVEKTKFSMFQEAMNTIAIAGEVFYEKFELEKDSQGYISIRPSSNLHLNMTEQCLTLRPTSTIRSIYEDAIFIKKLQSVQVLTIGEEDISFKGLILSDEFSEILEFFIDLYKALMVIECRIDKYFSLLKVHEFAQLRELVKIKRGETVIPLENGIYTHLWKFGDQYIPLWIIKNENGIELINAVYTDKFALGISIPEGSKESYRFPLFGQYKADVLSKLYEVKSDCFREQIDQSDISEESASYFVNIVLLLISAYDLSQNVNFLTVADYLADKLLLINKDSVNKINSLQIKRRRGQLTEADKKELCEISENEDEVRFGIYTLIGDLNNAKASLDRMETTLREDVKQWPIYKLYQELVSSLEN